VIYVPGIVNAQILPQGDPLEGAKLYDNWFTALDVPPPDGDHPLWSTQDSNVRSGLNTWLCYECHGWDYKGVNGVYSEGSHYTGFPGVIGVVGMSNDDIMAWLDGTNNKDHDFSEYIGLKPLYDLVAFLRTKIVDVDLLIDYESKRMLGNMDNGSLLFRRTCVRCHGLDGQSINFGKANNPAYLGDMVLNDPWKGLHQVRFGHPGTQMVSTEVFNWSLKELVDVLAYVQTLPTARDHSEPTVELATSIEGQANVVTIIIGAMGTVIVILTEVAWSDSKRRVMEVEETE
jgi:thiosulfate dehydrogenase